MLGDEATEKFIPAEVYGLRDADLELFLGRLWAGDIATSVQAVPYYATSSEMLAQGVQTLLLRLGILSGIHEFNYRDSLRPEYTVHLMDAASIETFIERVAPHALGQERRVELLCRSSTCHRQTRQETVPAPDVYWDTILSIEPLGIDDTYDLTVEGDHNFVANALFVHNSHSAAYALLAYQTAWLKTHYPAAFMAAVLSADMDNTDKVVSLIEECRQMRLKVLPPDINTSDYHFTVQGEDTILYGLGAIKGVGAAALQGVIEERGRHGRFRDLFEFCRRIDQRKINRRTLEALISAGAMDALGEGQRDGRAVLMASLPVALQMAEQHLRDHGVGQNDLFGGVSTREAEHVVRPAFVCAVQWTEEQRLAAEKDTLGLYLTGHPIARYERELARFITARLSELRPEPEQRVIAAGLVVALRTMNVRRGGRMAFISLDDRTARIEVSVFPELYQRHRELLTKDKLLVIEGMVSVDDYTGGHKLSADQIFDLDQARAAYAKGLVISLDTRRDANGIVRQLAQVLGSFREGMCQVYIDYQNAAACAQLALGPEWKVRPSEDLLQRLAEVAGRDKVEVVY
jgi:DNA polymerase-3 subunit alpha